MNTWFGLFAPAAVPAEAIRTINADINALLDTDETKQRFAALGGVPLRTTPEEFADWVRRETEKWRGVIQKEGLQLDAS